MKNDLDYKPQTISNIGRVFPQSVKIPEKKPIFNKKQNISSLLQNTTLNSLKNKEVQKIFDMEKYDNLAPNIFGGASLNVPQVKQGENVIENFSRDYTPNAMKSLYSLDNSIQATSSLPMVGGLYGSNDLLISPEVKNKYISSELDKNNNLLARQQAMFNTKLPESSLDFLKRTELRESNQPPSLYDSKGIHNPRFITAPNLTGFDSSVPFSSKDAEDMYGLNNSNIIIHELPNSRDQREKKDLIDKLSVPLPIDYYSTFNKKELVLPTFSILEGIKIPPSPFKVGEVSVLKSEKDVSEFVDKLRSATDVNSIKDILKNLDIKDLESVNVREFTSTPYSDITKMPIIQTSSILPNLKEVLKGNLLEVKETISKKVKDIYKYAVDERDVCIIIDARLRMSEIKTKLASFLPSYPKEIKIPIPLLLNCVTDSSLTDISTPSTTYTSEGIKFNLRGKHKKTSHKDCCVCVKKDDNSCKEFTCVNCDNPDEIFSQNILNYSTSYIDLEKVKIEKEERENSILKKLDVRIVADFASAYFTQNFRILSINDVAHLALGFALCFSIMEYRFDRNYKKTALLLDLFANVYLKNRNVEDYTISSNMMKVLPIIYASYETNSVIDFNENSILVEVTHNPE